MNLPGDLQRPAAVVVVDGHRRRWYTLWLRRHQQQRIVFAGYINSIRRDSRGTTVELEDEMTRATRMIAP